MHEIEEEPPPPGKFSEPDDKEINLPWRKGDVYCLDVDPFLATNRQLRLCSRGTNPIMENKRIALKSSHNIPPIRRYLGKKRFWTKLLSRDQGSCNRVNPRFKTTDCKSIPLPTEQKSLQEFIEKIWKTDVCRPSKSRCLPPFFLSRKRWSYALPPSLSKINDHTIKNRYLYPY